MTMSNSSAGLERKTIFAKRSELFLFARGETVIFLCFPIAPTAPTWEGNYPTLRPRHRFRFSLLVVFLSIDTIVNKNGLRPDRYLGIVVVHLLARGWRSTLPFFSVHHRTACDKEYRAETFLMTQGLLHL